ncbi:MAG: tRNA (guanosine(46)-N7)-methyltransferase TrmB [Oscillospiraceae bacterium]|nr:tRNA (guanosine(46)-N7)-methyltransferase TrmB [Oscillospiraceae bacterium]
MRMRKKPNLDTRMDNCTALMIAEPRAFKGIWRERFPDFAEIRLEIGCGKGRFTAETAKNHPEILLLAIEKVQSAMVMAMERVQSEGLKNVRFIDADAAGLGEMFSKGEISRIYLNFCDPWPKSRDAKFRLTAPGFLRSYADVLPLGGEIHFKTDNLPLFQWSSEMMESEGWVLQAVTLNLHENGSVGVMTDYEARFAAEGVPIKRLEAVKTSSTKDSSAGVPPRLRNAALSDARNC